MRGYGSWVLLLAFASGCARLNPETFAPLDQAGHALVVSITGRPSLPTFRPLREEYTSALIAVRPRLHSSREWALFGDYEVVDSRLNEMLTVWDGLEIRDEAMLAVFGPLGAQLKTRYDLPVNTNEPPSIYAMEALVALRDDIKKRLTDIASMLRR